MKIIAQEEIGICVDDITGVISYIHRGDEFEIYPTEDGMKFVFCNNEFSPYDFMGKFEFIE
nr:MAG TPA: hypothetical protein [Caudoviricetes sp.]